jgi:KaiC/GvpD/RAD55 family RecA-like ATPase
VAKVTGENATIGKQSVVDVLPDNSGGSDVLVVGPTLSDKDRIAFEILADSWKGGRAPFVITATDTDAQFRDRFEPFVPAGHPAEELYVIDCTEQTPDSQSSCSVNSPVDLTGIAVCLSKGYDQFESGRRRILLDTISTLLIYSSMKRVYRFLSKLNSRASELGDSTVQLLDSDSIDTEDRNTLFQLFPIVIEVRDEGDSTLFRVHGDTETSWYEFQPRQGDRR